MRTYFNIVGPVDLDALGAFVADYLGVPRALVCVYDNSWDIDGPFEERAAGCLWGAYERTDVAVQVGHSEPGAGPVGGWFILEAFELLDPHGLARAAAAFLNTTILVPDPEPGDTSQYADAAQLEITPQGGTRRVWFVEFGEDGRSKNAIDARD